MPASFVFSASAALALFLTYLQIRLSPVLRLTAVPRDDRWHKRPTPSSGGIAILCAAATIYVILFRGHHTAVASGALALWALGLVDDRVRLRAAVKLAGQCAVSASVVASGVVLHATPYEALNILVSFSWMVGITNAFNLIDNMDGLCAGVTVIIAGFGCFLLGARGDWDEAGLYALIAGVYAGFLVSNYRPAKIFMGDSGSMLAGFSLAALTIATPIPYTQSSIASLFYPALTFIYPIFDTILVFVLRKVRHRPISAGGKDHSSHRLVLLGLGEARAVAILWTLTAVGSAIGLLVEWLPMGLIIGGTVLCGLLAVFGRFLAGVSTDFTAERCQAPASSPHLSFSENRLGVDNLSFPAESGK
jgi:UDP-GlcNAc:undecaprenyl-phosphate GlcNAc-1-phosphate transferase